MSTDGERVTLRIQVRPSPETNDHEVLLFGDDQDLVERFGDESIGLDPEDILIQPCPLLLRGAHECLIGRCECGVIGCADVRVQVSVGEEVVRWAAVDGPREPLRFDLDAYTSEVLRALSDHSWETPDRTASRLVRQAVDKLLLRRLGFTLSWASGQADQHLMTIALRLERGPYQVLVRVAWRETDSPGAIADAVAALLKQPPTSWPDVVWFPQAAASGPPALAGAGWRRYQNA